jgi:hypothetical protein
MAFPAVSISKAFFACKGGPNENLQGKLDLDYYMRNQLMLPAIPVITFVTGAALRYAVAENRDQLAHADPPPPA